MHSDHQSLHLVGGSGGRSTRMSGRLTVVVVVPFPPWLHCPQNFGLRSFPKGVTSYAKILTIFLNWKQLTPYENVITFTMQEKCSILNCWKRSVLDAKSKIELPTYIARFSNKCGKIHPRIYSSKGSLSVESSLSITFEESVHQHLYLWYIHWLCYVPYYNIS